MANVTEDCSQILAGPAKISLGGNTLGYTSGGITATIEPQTRGVMVDQTGQTPCKMIHLGDNFKVTASLAQWVAATIKAAYPAGYDDSAASTTPSIGLGRLAGYVYAPLALIVIPTITADVAKVVNMWKAVATGGLELAFNNDDDRLFAVEWTGLLDGTKTDGNCVGSIVIAATNP